MQEENKYPDVFVMVLNYFPSTSVTFSIQNSENGSRRSIDIDEWQLEATVKYIREAYHPDTLFVIPDEDDQGTYDTIKAMGANVMTSIESYHHLKEKGAL